MERKFDFHVTICEEKDQVRVTADAEKPLIGEFLACAAGVVSYVAQSIAANGKRSEREVLHRIASVIAEMSGEEQEGEENGSVEQRV